MQHEFLILEEKVKEICKKGPVYYYVFHGNWGDAFIRAGTLKFLNDNGIHYKELSSNKKEWIIPFMRGGTVIFQGSGAWCKFYSEPYNNVKKFQRRFNVIILPATFENSYSFNNNVTYFCRDKHESQQNMPNAKFCPDMAFYLGKLDYPKSSGTGYFFRTDVESAKKVDLPPTNRDISAEGDHFADIAPFIEAISKFEIIHTDRLHVSIAACLLGREVHLYPNSYFKNKAVFETSIKDYFPNVYFHESLEI